MDNKVAEFSINYQQFLDVDGKLNSNAKLDFLQDKTILLKLYKMLVLNRIFDSKAITLQRTGKLGTYPSTLGQEAIGVAIGAAMAETDVLCGYYREYGAQLWRGVTMTEILNFWGGCEQGSNYQNAKVKQDFPMCIPISSQNLHAVGVATAIKLRKQQRAVVAVVGDGGTSRGDFYEAINVAGVWNLPVVFIINNNHWAISVPNHKQTAAKTFAQKAIAAGISALQVDGNDIFVLLHNIKQALIKAYAGNGPSVIEAITYRMGDHTTADDAKRYRSNAEVAAYQNKDPILRLQKYLLDNSILTTANIKEFESELKSQVELSVQDYLNFQPEPKTAMLDYLYATLPQALQAQRQELLKD